MKLVKVFIIICIICLLIPLGLFFFNHVAHISFPGQSCGTYQVGPSNRCLPPFICITNPIVADATGICLYPGSLHPSNNYID